MGKGFDQYAAQYDSWFLDNPNVLLSEARLVASTLTNSKKHPVGRMRQRTL